MDIDSAMIPQPTLMERLRGGGEDWTETDFSNRAAIGKAVSTLLDDLRRLLNTRRPFVALSDQFDGLQSTVLGYGLPDTTHMSLRNVEQRNRFRQELEAAILTFEPRLSDVRLEEVKHGGRNAVQRLSIRISALFAMDGEPVPIVFDTTLNDVRDRITVEAVDGSS